MIDVLVVGTAVDTLERVKSLLESRRLTVRSAKVTVDSGVAALVSLVEEVRPRLVIVDVDQFEEPVLDFLRQIFSGSERPNVLLLVALGQADLVRRAIEIGGAGHVDFRIKPFDSGDFVLWVKLLLRRAVRS